jgi:hypothetical protein
LQPQQQVEDAGPGGQVEGGGRLVGDQHPRFQRESAGHADPLPLAAGELLGPPVREPRVE